MTCLNYFLLEISAMQEGKKIIEGVDTYIKVDMPLDDFHNTSAIF